MTHSRVHSYGNKIGGQEQQRSPFENLPVKFQRQSSKENRELVTDVRSAVFSHLEVDPAESTQLDQSPVELHVHHHHHLYVDNEQQQPASPRATDRLVSAGKSNLSSKTNLKDYEEIANNTLLDLLWTKHKPYYGQGTNRKSWKQDDSKPPSEVPQLGKERKHASGKVSSKSKIRYLEETAQDRIKRLSDLGTLVSKAEAECDDESRSSCDVLQRKETASQTHMEQCKFLSKNRPKEEIFKEESEAAEAGFVSALKAAKDRLRDLVNECARANGIPESVHRKQKELQEMEMLQYYFHNRDESSTGDYAARPSTESPSPCSEVLYNQPVHDSVMDAYMSLDQSFTPSTFQQSPSLERPEPEPEPEPASMYDRKKEDGRSASPLVVYESDAESPKISSTIEYMKLFERYQVAPQTAKETTSATAPWTTALKSELSKLVSGLSLNNVEGALQNVEKKLSNVEDIRDQAVEAVRRCKEKSRKEKVAEVPVKEKLNVLVSAKSVSQEPKPEYSGFTLFDSPLYEPRSTGSKEELVDMLSVVVTESERLEAFLEETKQKFLAEDRKNSLLKECVGDPSLYEKEHAILDSALTLNSELLENLSGMNYALTSYGATVKHLLPFVEEHLAITERLRESASTPHTVEVRVPSSASSRGKIFSPLPSIWEEKAVSENSEVQFMLIREIEETKKQSREMVEIMDSLGHHYDVLRTKFTQMGTEVTEHESDPGVMLLTEGESSSSGDNRGGDLTGSPVAQRKMELQSSLHSLEREISLSYQNVQELKKQTQEVKSMMESKEEEADNIKRQTDEIQCRVLQLEEELEDKARQIAALQGMTFE